MMTNPVTQGALEVADQQATTVQTNRVRRLPKATVSATKPQSRGRSPQSLALLHTSLVTGSLLATLLGANLLAGSDNAAANQAQLLAGGNVGDDTKWAATAADSGLLSGEATGALILAPVPTVHSPRLSPHQGQTPTTTTSGANAIQLNLGALPEVIVPNIAALPATADNGVNAVDLNALLSVDLPTIPDVQQQVQQAAQRASQQSSQSSAPVSRSRSSR